VHAELVLVAEPTQCRVRDGADAHLQCRTVVDEVGDVLADGILDRRRRPWGVSEQRTIRVGECGHSRERHQRVAERPRHLLVDLRDDRLRRYRRGERRVDGGTQRAVAMDIGG